MFGNLVYVIIIIALFKKSVVIHPYWGVLYTCYVRRLSYEFLKFTLRMILMYYSVISELSIHVVYGFQSLSGCTTRGASMGME